MFFSQKGQDHWLMEEVFASQRGGYFVDLAAAHPKNNSNTFCLEKTFDWTGVCIEANPQLVKLLREHRTATVIDACVDEGSETVDLWPRRNVLDSNTLTPASPTRPRHFVNCSKYAFWLRCVLRGDGKLTLPARHAER
jgi:hypothetical protein